MRRIAIVGGGPGGLFTALLLGQKCAEPLDVTIFEASDRLGGKVQTKRFDSAPVPFEAGAAELYQYGKDPLRLLLKNVLGLPVVRMRGRAVVMDGHILHGPEDFGRVYGKGALKAFKKFDKAARRGRAFEGFYDCSQPEENGHPLANRTLASLLDGVEDANARRYIEVMIHSDLATEPHKTSALYGVDNYLMNDPDYCKLYSIEGGMERMIAALAEAAPARFEMETRVERVEKAGDLYRVAYRRDGEALADHFDSVVAALPLAWLPGVEWGGKPLKQAMLAHYHHHDYPAHYLRVSVLFERPFWREHLPESFFMLDAFGGCCVYDEGSRHEVGPYGVLAWLLGGDAAEEMSRLPDGELAEAVVASLPSEVAHGRGLVLEAKVHRWLGTVSARPGGRFVKGLEERHLPEPQEHPALFVVGDYMFDTSINGALDSADYASDMVLKALGLPGKNLGSDYFDYYVGNRRYHEAYKETFDARYVVGLIKNVWDARPPYSLLDAGSASGLTLAGFADLGVDATGVECSPYIHAQTPKKWRARNVLGDVRELPFEEGAFDFVYETCLAYVPERDLAAAIGELHRVARRGLVLGSVVGDVRPELVRRYDLHYAAETLLTLDEWAERLRPFGFTPAVTEPRVAERLWKVRPRCFGGDRLFAAPSQLAGCFFTKDRTHAHTVPFDRASADVRKTRQVI